MINGVIGRWRGTEHLLDQLYNDIDPSGYATPGGPRGISTPLTPRSRSVSVDNFGPLNMASTDTTANALQARLSSIDMLGGPAGSHYSPREGSQPPISSEGVVERDVCQTVTPFAIFEKLAIAWH